MLEIMLTSVAPTVILYDISAFIWLNGDFVCSNDQNLHKVFVL